MEVPEYVKGLKGNAESEYRQGDVSISIADIGLAIATVEETKEFLNINQ